MKIFRRVLPLLAVICILSGLFPEQVFAEIAGPEAFENMQWTKVFEDDLVTSGYLQSVCCTENYIITIENTADDPKKKDVVSAYYKNWYDEKGNPVEQYSLAKRSTDSEWEHGNGMCYNPNTHEVYVALYTNTIQENRGCIYVMDPDTLRHTRTIKLSDDFNVLGIAYRSEYNQYVIMTNKDANYSFMIYDENFQLVEDLGPADLGTATNSQDMTVIEDYIINCTSDINVYYLPGNFRFYNQSPDLGEWDASFVEPESFCVTSPGVIMVAATVEKNGTRKACFYETALPYYFSVSSGIEGDGTVLVVDENGNPVEDPTKIMRGSTVTVQIIPAEYAQLSKMYLNDFDVTDYLADNTFTLQNIQASYTGRAVFSLKEEAVEQAAEFLEEVEEEAASEVADTTLMTAQEAVDKAMREAEEAETLKINKEHYKIINFKLFLMVVIIVLSALTAALIIIRILYVQRERERRRRIRARRQAELRRAIEELDED